MASTDQEVVPVHVGLILDGNRRWAKERGLPPLQGHKQGYETLRTIVRHAMKRGVRYVSAYIFSTENWNRTSEEVAYLMDLFVWIATKEIDQYVADGFRVVFLGSRERLSSKVIRAMDSAEEKTRHNTKAVLALCLNYGGQLELAEGVARLVKDGVKPEDVTVDKLSEYLYAPDIPPIDFLIRSSGEQRLSNFMLWRAAYAELWFSDTLWPAFTVEQFDGALAEYAQRQRRFGK